MSMVQRVDLDWPLPEEAVAVAVRTVGEVVGPAGLRTVARQSGLEALLEEHGALRSGVTVCFRHVGQLT